MEVWIYDVTSGFRALGSYGQRVHKLVQLSSSSDRYTTLTMQSNVGDPRIYEAGDQRCAVSPLSLILANPKRFLLPVHRYPKTTRPEEGSREQRERFAHGPGPAHFNLDSKYVALLPLPPSLHIASYRPNNHFRKVETNDSK